MEYIISRYVVNKNTWIMGKFKKIGEVIEISDKNAKHFLSKGFIATSGQSKIEVDKELAKQSGASTNHISNKLVPQELVTSKEKCK